tara:strand:- start:255 stop:419 length:165 start_codon:yes stop_codon:yes gene_type:complete
MKDEYFVVDFGSASISKTDYIKIVTGELSFKQWIKDNPPQVDTVLTEDGKEVEL